MRIAAVVGDTTTHGGSITSAGQTILRANGRFVAVTGALNSEPPPSPTYPHGSSSMTGSAILRVNGLPVVLSGDSAACGATVSATGLPLRSD